jgi:prepilin-type N-terminal cleavage/methylation domain-containing protein
MQGPSPTNAGRAVACAEIGSRLGLPPKHAHSWVGRTLRVSRNQGPRGKPGWGGAGARRGFSLAEVVAVLLLIGILAVVAVPRLVNTQSELVAAADALVQQLSYARSRAMATTNVWALSYGTASTLTRDGTAFPLPDAGTPLPAGVTIPAGSITFDGWGTPVGGQRDIALTAGGDTRTVRVWAETGLAEVQ